MAVIGQGEIRSGWAVGADWEIADLMGEGGWMGGGWGRVDGGLAGGGLAGSWRVCSWTEGSAGKRDREGGGRG